MIHPSAGVCQSESIKILGYPNSTASPASLDGILTQKILSFFLATWIYHRPMRYAVQIGQKELCLPCLRSGGSLERHDA